MTRIKFCGLTRLEDVRLAAGLGVDAVGFVMSRKSKRYIAPAAAVRLRDAVPPYIATVALVMDDEPAYIDEVLRVLRPDMLQFHGNESDDECATYGVRLHDFPRAAGLLLDGHGLGEQGGSGQRFDWSLMPKDLAQPLILAGGLTPDNVAEALRVARPWAVDVSSGIESSPGIKDRAKMECFISAVRR
jgi:phosphoribosylanthranilate isomerase